MTSARRKDEADDPRRRWPVGWERGSKIRSTRASSQPISISRSSSVLDAPSIDPCRKTMASHDRRRFVPRRSGSEARRTRWFRGQAEVRDGSENEESPPRPGNGVRRELRKGQAIWPTLGNDLGDCGKGRAAATDGGGRWSPRCTSAYRMRPTAAFALARTGAPAPPRARCRRRGSGRARGSRRTL